MIISEAERLSMVSEYYFSRKLQQIADMRKSGIPVINLGIGSPDLMPSEATIKALAESASKSENHGYQSYRGSVELRAAIAKWYLQTYNVALNPDSEILPLIGSKEGITHISMAFLNPGDEVLVPNPGYPTYTSVSNLAGATVRYYDLLEDQNWAVDIVQLRKQDLSKVKLMWINYPNMPTGADATDSLFEQLITLAHEKKFLICNDNPYSLVLNDNPKSILSYAGASEVALELNSLSKSHNMAGWRLGWVMGQKDYINTILKFKSNVDSGTFLPMQHAAVAALNNDNEWHKSRNEIYANRRKHVCAIFDKLGCRYNTTQVGMFIWAKVPDSVANVEAYVEDILQKAHVFITPGFIFGTNGARYVRISLTSPEALFMEALARIEKYLGN